MSFHEILEFEGHVTIGLIQISQTGKKVHISTQNPGEKSSSSWETVINGVPQDLILGALLFVIYINDLPYGVYHTPKPIIYAEDTSVLITVKNINELQIELRLNWTT